MAAARAQVELLSRCPPRALPAAAAACTVRPRRPPRRAPPRPAAAPNDGASVATTREATTASGDHPQQRARDDPFVAAGLRLQVLLNGVGDGEDELLEGFLNEEAPERKLLVTAAVSSMLGGSALFISWLCDCDPLGGAELSAHSARAALLGCAAAAPMAALRAWGWTPAGARAAPALDDARREMERRHRPWLVGLDTPQLAAALALDTLPLALLALPAAQGALGALLSTYLRALGLEVPEPAAAAAALAITASAAALLRGAGIGVEEEQVEILRDAVASSERFYRLMSGRPDGSSAAADARAFKAVAVSYILTRQDAAAAAALAAAVDTVALGLLWRATGDLAAPAAAMLICAGVDYAAMHRAASSSSGPPGSERSRQPGRS